MDRPFLAGVRAMLPVTFAMLPFAILLGVTAANLGWPWWRVLLQSVFIVAGAAQLAMVRLLDEGAPAIVVIATAALINLRFAMYGAALRPWFAGAPRRLRALVAYVLTDQAFAVGTRDMPALEAKDRWPFYLGSALTLPVMWFTVTTASAIVGARLPAAWPLEFAVPLTFLALLAPALRTRGAWIAAGAAGAIATAAAVLPYNVNLLLGALAGIGLGAAFEVKR
ncbi:MAG TPA: AzlC family ABC transporter permease [Candidatus Thermoplasmatota archaeon]|nr:AzlC family ABC transporter permease [Candidatus Thermoplasmatota archaeon]